MIYKLKLKKKQLVFGQSFLIFELCHNPREDWKNNWFSEWAL